MRGMFLFCFAENIICLAAKRCKKFSESAKEKRECWLEIDTSLTRRIDSGLLILFAAFAQEGAGFHCSVWRDMISY